MRKGYKHLTEAVEAEICRLKAEDKKSEKEIAGIVHVHRNTVYRTLRDAGLALPYRGARTPVLTKAQKRHILRLLLKGLSMQRIATRLNLRIYLVRKFAEENRFQRQDRLGKFGGFYYIPADALAKLTQEIQSRTNFAVDLAEKYPGLSYKRLLKLAHQVLGCPRFRCGRRPEPLTSDFPQKHFPGEIGHG